MPALGAGYVGSNPAFLIISINRSFLALKYVYRNWSEFTYKLLKSVLQYLVKPVLVKN